jgi:hypothetical protein
VAAKPFCGRVHDDVSSIFDHWTQESTCSQDVVDIKRHSSGMSKIGDVLQIWNADARVATFSTKTILVPSSMSPS